MTPKPKTERQLMAHLRLGVRTGARKSTLVGELTAAGWPTSRAEEQVQKEYSSYMRELWRNIAVLAITLPVVTIICLALALVGMIWFAALAIPGNAIGLIYYLICLKRVKSLREM